MHMTDALISPEVGVTMWAASAGIIVCCSRKLRTGSDSRTAPLMGVLGAFIFAAQMINFTIPVTGSSGHLGGGLLLSVLLGPSAAFLTIASVLTVQALFFADGGLLALGCNIFNLGFFPAFIACPLLYRRICGTTPSPARITAASLIAAIAGSQMSALAVVLETTSSGISSLPFTTFAAMMQPIHLAVGIAEGVVTASIISFVYKARPDIILIVARQEHTTNRHVRTIVLVFSLAALITGGYISRLASEKPDGLEWSITQVTGLKELNGPGRGMHHYLNELQMKAAFLPDYSFKYNAEEKKARQNETDAPPGTGVAGAVGATITFAIVLMIGIVLRRRNAAARIIVESSR